VPVSLRTDAEPAPGHLTVLEFDELGRHHYRVPDFSALRSAPGGAPQQPRRVVPRARRARRP
jgi:hypothetical protein